MQTGPEAPPESESERRKRLEKAIEQLGPRQERRERLVLGLFLILCSVLGLIRGAKTAAEAVQRSAVKGNPAYALGAITGVALVVVIGIIGFRLFQSGKARM
jgi:hypothetical protein